MKHAGPATLDLLESFLAEVRRLPEFEEKSRGTFYRNGSATLHFHEDPTGIFADVKIEGKWYRCDVTNEVGQTKLAAALRRRFPKTEKPPE